MKNLLSVLVISASFLTACSQAAQKNPEVFARGDKITVVNYATPMTYDSVRVIAKRGQSGNLPFMELQIQNQDEKYIQLEVRPVFYDKHSNAIALDASESRPRQVVIPPRELKAVKIFAPSNRVESINAQLVRLR